MQPRKSTAQTARAHDPHADGTAGERERPPLKVVRRSSLADLSPQEREFLPRLLEIEETPASPLHRRVLWTIMSLVVVAITWSCIGKLAVVASAQGKFIPDGRVKQIQPMETSVVKAIHVREGQHVNAGDILLELDPAINAAELKTNADQLKMNQLEQARLSAELGGGSPTYEAQRRDAPLVALQENLRRSRDAAFGARVAEGTALIAERNSAVAAAAATLHKYEELTKLSKQREEDARPLLETGAISRLDYMQLKQDLVTNENDLAAQVKTLEQARYANAEAVKQLEGLRHTHVSDIYQDLGKKVYDASGLTGSVEKSRQLYELKWLRSPVNGIVQRVDVATTGGVVTPAQNLVTIVPDGTPLIVEATLSNDDIGYVRTGQDVEIKVDTFPFQKYGTLKGKLTWISADAEERGASESAGTSAAKSASDPKSAKPSYVYKIHIQPQIKAFIIGGQSTSVQPGMTLQADINTDERRVIEFFLAPIIKYLDEGLKVR
jgi:hemolysin D